MAHGTMKPPIRRSLSETRPLPNNYMQGVFWHVGKTMKNKKTIYLHCHRRNKALCQVKATYKQKQIAPGRYEWVLKTKATLADHTHGFHPMKERVDIFHEKLYQAAIKSICPLELIFERLEQQDPEAAAHILFSFEKPKMERWRKKKPLPEPADYTALVDSFKDNPVEGFFAYEGGSLSMKALTIQDQVKSLIIGDPKFPGEQHADKLLCISVETLTRPKIGGTKYVLSVSAQHKKYVFTFAWALFKDITMDDLTATVALIKHNFTKNYQVTKILTNCDWRLIEAIKKNWTGLEILPTFHSYVMAILKRASTIRGLNLKDPSHMIILKKVIGLALLPGPQISKTFNWLVRNVNDEIYTIFEPLLKWFLHGFLKTLEPEYISFFERTDQLTNISINPSKKLVTLGQPKDIPTMLFFQKTLKIASSSCKDMKVLKEKGKKANLTMTPKTELCIPKGILNRAWGMLKDEVITPERFLSVISFHISCYVIDLMAIMDKVNGLYSPMSPEKEEKISADQLDARTVGTRSEEVFEEVNVDKDRKNPKKKAPPEVPNADSSDSDEEIL